MRALALALALLGCDSESADLDATPAPEADAAEHVDVDSALPDAAPDADPATRRAATVAHSFGRYTLAAHEEVQPCVIWTLNNDEAVYVNRVTLGNDGAFHHSNWFVVPDTLYPGEDGFFDCGERDFQELKSAVAGTVIFAQSTQSLVEEQQLAPGVAIKVPPRHSVVAGAHLLNLADRGFETELRMELGLIHPEEVHTLLAPFRLNYADLDIPPQAESRFTGACDFSQALMGGTFKLHWVLPHYHYLGNYFRLEAMGGPADGRTLFGLDGFNADANGRLFDPPLDLTEATGLRFTCGYYNNTDETVRYGITDQEMCVMLGLAEMPVMIDASVSTTEAESMEGPLHLRQGPCDVIGVPRNPAQGPPTEEEMGRPMYVPPTAAGDEGVRGVAECVDTPEEAEAASEPTLENIRSQIFRPSCSFSSCHAGETAQKGLDLTAEDLRAELIEHAVQSSTELALVEPGDASKSYLFHVLSRCEPEGGPNMPLNAPSLLDPTLVALVRDWIDAGAR